MLLVYVTPTTGASLTSAVFYDTVSQENVNIHGF